MKPVTDRNGKTRRRGSRQHTIFYRWTECYVIAWRVDRYYRYSNIIEPMTTRIETDRGGAERFAKKWGLTVPTQEAPTSRRYEEWKL